MRPRHLILIVDDDQSIRSVLEDVLGMEGYQVRTAPDGETALAVVARLTPALVLLDLQMPVLDGWQTHARLRELAPNLPVIYMTAGHRAREEAERHQAAGYLSKPFELDQLLDVVARFVSEQP